MVSRFQRFLIAMMFALLSAGVTLIIVRAQDASPTPPPAQPTQTNGDNCASCHKDVSNMWQTGKHGQAMTDPVFNQSWTAQDKPGACLICHSTGYDPATGQSKAESVSCTACHNPVPANHPADKMPTDTSSDLCGKCHSDPRFATADWKLSAHYQRAMTCTTCHDPHTAGMKHITGQVVGTDASALCENCHKDAMQNFPLSKHAQADVTCVNCHLGFKVSSNTTTAVDFASVHKAPDHSFVPSIATCNSCHSNQMHAPGQAVAAAAIKIEQTGGTPTPQPIPVATPIPPVSNEPAPVSPFGFVLMAGILGMAGGIVLTPWLDRTYHKYIFKGGNHE
jgi:predicted CXXCH cytochrome family protein